MLGLVVVVALCVAVPGGMFLGLVAEGVGSVSGAPHDTGADAIWLGHDWVGAGFAPAKLDPLVARIGAGGFRDMFVHVGPLSDDGSWNRALAPNAPALLAALRQRLPGVRVLAWLGDVVGPDHLNLAAPSMRAAIVASARAALDLGFAGVHYDLEPVPDGDPGYLALLAGTRALTRSRHALLSVAADQLEPGPGLAGPEQWLMGRPHPWSTGFLGEVATTVDETAIMTYDTGMPTEAAYSGYVRWETRLALRCVPPAVRLLIGLPAYHTGEPGHTGAETVAAAVRGVRLALRDTSRPVGVALYAEFTATTADWAAYESGWVRPPG